MLRREADEREIRRPAGFGKEGIALLAALLLMRFVVELNSADERKIVSRAHNKIEMHAVDAVQ